MKKKSIRDQAVKRTSSGAKRTGASPVHVEPRRVLVGDPQALVRLGWRQFLASEQDLICCGEVEAEAELREAVRQLRPDLLVMDLWLHSADGLETLKALRAEFPKLLVLVCSQFDEGLYAERALRAGALGFIGKGRPLTELHEAIRTVLAGDFYLSRKMSALLLRQNVQGKKAWGSSGMESLTDRELQVFTLVGAGISSRDMATMLGISLKTIETYRENIKHKFGLRDAAELMHHATLFVNGTGAAVEAAR